MASVGYGLYTYGKSNYGTPVYHFGAATIQASSGFTAESSVQKLASATSAQTSDFNAVGHKINLGAATSAATS